MNGEQWIPIARIGRPQGVTGDVRVYPFAADSETLFHVSRVAVGSSEGDLRELKLGEVAARGKFLVVHLEGVKTPEEGKGLRGLQIYVRRKDFPKTSKGQFYCCDLIGFSVLTEEGQYLGKLEEIWPTVSNDIYVVRDSGNEILLPSIPSVVSKIDLKNKKIVAHPPEVIDAV